MELTLLGVLVTSIGLTVAGCGAGPGRETGRTRPEGAPGSSGDHEAPRRARPEDAGVAGTVVTFAAGGAVVEVTVRDDTPTTRSFLAMLPMTLDFTDFGGREKVSQPQQPFDYRDAEGMQPRNGDLFSYRPWGNLGFWYDAEGVQFSPDLVRIGTTDDLEEVMQLDGRRVHVAVQPR